MNEDPHAETFRVVPIEEISIPASRARPLGEVRELVDSIRTVGLLEPIIVGADGTLVAGLHRLEACRQLGFKTVPVVVIELDPIKLEMAELDENLCHQALAPLERSLHLARRKELHEMLYPETRHGGAPGRAGGGKEARDPASGSFVSEMAARTGRGRSTIAEEVRIGERLAPDVVEALRGTAVADSKSELSKLADLTPEQQRQEVERNKAASRAASATGEADNRSPRPDIFDDLDDMKSVSRGLVQATRALERLQGGWAHGPGPDVDPLAERLPRVLEGLRQLLLTFEDEWIPRTACSPCSGPACPSCGGLTWLSRARVRALGLDR